MPSASRAAAVRRLTHVNYWLFDYWLFDVKRGEGVGDTMFGLT